MAIRDRGKKKWQFAFGMPELIKAQRDLWRDSERVEKPIIDVYELEEFDQRICFAMEFNLLIRFDVWDDGFIHEIVGTVHHYDEIAKVLKVEIADEETFERIAFDDVVGVVVID